MTAQLTLDADAIERRRRKGLLATVATPAPSVVPIDDRADYVVAAAAPYDTALIVCDGGTGYARCWRQRDGRWIVGAPGDGYGPREVAFAPVRARVVVAALEPTTPAP